MPRHVRVIFLVSALLIATCTGTRDTQEHFSARELSFEGIYGRRASDTATYILLGSGYLRPMTTDPFGVGIRGWLVAHPDAVAVPICRLNELLRGGRVADPLVYVWIEDKGRSLNVDLIREGVYPGGVMIDMVEAEKRLIEELSDLKFAVQRAQIEKEQADTPNENRPKRLVSEADYAKRMRLVQEAEIKAREEKKGIWSDGSKEEREVEGVE